jgi:hypothetical protein
MKYVFGVLGVLSILSTLVTCATAKSAIHEVIGGIAFLAGIVCLAAGALLSELGEVRAALQPTPPESHKALPPIKD